MSISHKRIAGNAGHLCLALVLLAGLLAGCLFSEPAPPADTSLGYTVIIVLDAARPDYFDLAPMPNLRSLMAAGTYYDQAWVAQIVNNTPPGHASIATGLFPIHSGVPAFNWINPATRQVEAPFTTQAVMAGEVNRLLEAAGARTLADWYKAAYPQAKAVALSSYKSYAAAPMGGKSADVIAFSISQAGSAPANAQGEREAAEAAVADTTRQVPAGVKGQEPPPSILNDRRLVLKNPETPGAENGWAIDLALALFKRYHPQITLINLPETDEKGHRTGADPDAIRPLMEKFDRDLGRLMAAYKAAGVYEKTVWVIISDHGMIPNTQAISQTLVEPLVPLNDRNIALVNLPYIWLTDPARAPALAGDLARLGLPNNIAIYAKSHDAAGAYRYQPAAAGALDPRLAAAYDYLLSTCAFARGPDIVLLSRDYMPFGSRTKQSRGLHRDITWTTQHIPLLIAGPGVRAGQISHAPARLVDIAPTVMALLNVPHGALDGVVLADALLSPDATQAQAFDAMQNALAPLRDALRQRSVEDRAALGIP